MTDLYAGKTYQLIRKSSRPVDMTLIVSWLEPNQKGKSIRRYIFAMTARQQSK